jgi:transposase
MRRGRTYGTIVVDLERRRRVDLLPDRSSETLAAWLAQRPGIEIISRDRSGAYADAARQGAPGALQVADRWHLLKNAGDALDRVLGSEGKILEAVARSLSQSRWDAAADRVAEAAAKATPVLKCAEREKIERRERRLARYERVIELFCGGRSKRAIASEVGLDVQTVRKFIASEGFPERAPRVSRSELDAYEPYLRSRWAEGCRNATTMWREIRERGYRGVPVNVRRIVAKWRGEDGRGRWKKHAPPGAEPPKPVATPSPRQAKWLLIREVADLEGDERELRKHLETASTRISQATELTRSFNTIVRERRAGDLTDWIARAKASGIETMVSLANGLEVDRQAVAAALSCEWSNGQLEGQINRLKAIKRSMYGRAKFDLLRKRVLGMS